MLISDLPSDMDPGEAYNKFLKQKIRNFLLALRKIQSIQRGFNPIQFVLAQGREKIPRSYRDGNPDDELERRRKLMLRVPTSSNLNSAIRRGCRMGLRKRIKPTTPGSG